METGQLRELRPKLAYFFFPRWSPQGRTGLYRIDTQRDVTLVVAPHPASSKPQWAVDGKRVYHRRDSSIVERDLAAGTDARLCDLQPKQHAEPLAHIGHDVGWSLRLKRESPRLPIEVLDVIGEDNP
jgi:hypothetical protein